MPDAVVMTGFGPPEVLKWAQVPLPEPGERQIRIKAAGISPTDLALRVGYLRDIRSIGDGVTALLFSPGGYAEYAVASIWTRKPDTVSWIDAAALPSSASHRPSPRPSAYSGTVNDRSSI
jgi:NADPH:quinone reductase-like Zn-dependent oxidoreductase